MSSLLFAFADAPAAIRKGVKESRIHDTNELEANPSPLMDMLFADLPVCPGGMKMKAGDPATETSTRRQVPTPRHARWTDEEVRELQFHILKVTVEDLFDGRCEQRTWLEHWLWIMTEEDPKAPELFSFESCCFSNLADPEDVRMEILRIAKINNVPVPTHTDLLSAFPELVVNNP